MNVSASPLRLILLVGVLVILGALAATMMLGQSASTSTSGSHVIVRRHVQSKPAPSPRHVAPAPVFSGGKLSPSEVKPVPRPVPIAVKQALKAGLPARVARGFARGNVVLVALYAKEAPLDRMALKEAKAGAALGGASLVAVDVTAKASDKLIRALTKDGGTLESPALLVYKRPAKLFVRLDGFADHQTVAQAALNAGL